MGHDQIGIGERRGEFLLGGEKSRILGSAHAINEIFARMPNPEEYAAGHELPRCV